MLRWLVPTILCTAAPSLAATLTCAADGARIEGTKAAQVDVALDGHLYRLANPNAAKPLPGADSDADRLCAARMGMVAIVLPAPKPGPDETGRTTDALMLRLRSTALALHDPYASPLGGFGQDDLSDLEVDENALPAPVGSEASEDAPANADPSSGGGVEPGLDLGAAAAQGCSTTTDEAPLGLVGLFGLLMVGLRRRNGGAQ